MLARPFSRGDHAVSMTPTLPAACRNGCRLAIVPFDLSIEIGSGHRISRRWANQVPPAARAVQPPAVRLIRSPQPNRLMQ